MYRHTPYASGPEDTPSEILYRIGNSNLDLKSGNWLVVSADAKVPFLYWVIVLGVCIKNTIYILGFSKKVVAYRSSSTTNSLSSSLKSMDNEQR